MSDKRAQKKKIRKTLDEFRLSFHRSLAKKRSVRLPPFPAQKFMSDDSIQKTVSVIKKVSEYKYIILFVLLMLLRLYFLFATGE